MFSHFFIDRPIFATVVSVVVALAGGLALLNLPVAQYPEISPPAVTVSISYPGASAQVVADTVAAPIEQQVNGVPGMLYLSSNSGNDGSYSLTVTFEIGTPLNTALVMVQNRVQLALPVLPTAVQLQGITVRKRTPDILSVISFVSDGRYDTLYLSNFATTSVRDELLRLDGVSDVTIFGQRDYSMRLWLDPQKLAARNLTALDVQAAVPRQNVQAAPGGIGQPPAGRSRGFQFPLDTLGRLTAPEQFGDIILKASTGGVPPALDPTAVAGGGSSPTTSNAPTTAAKPVAAGVPTPGVVTSDVGGSRGVAAPGGPTAGGVVGPDGLRGGAGDGGPAISSAVVRVRDVARVELGANQYTSGAAFDGVPSVGLAIRLLPGANALEVSRRVSGRLAELKPRFPEGIDYNTAYDTTPFIRDSVRDVVVTLFEAVGLVALVVLVFLQSWRAALIPIVAVPVAILGTFAVMYALGFTVNNISLFGLVLAIGIVVDDAIVVVENVERWLDDGLAPREAAYKAMDEVTGPIVAIALVLSAVFIPCAFVGGISGQFYRQFAVTIAASTVLSAVNSLTLSPALAALLLKPRRDPNAPRSRGSRLASLAVLPLTLFGRAFNWGFDRATSLYTRVVGLLLRVSVIVLVVYGGLLTLTYAVFMKAPVGFVPEQDQGRLIVSIQLPDSASLQRTNEVMAQVDAIARATPGVAHTTSAAGVSLVAGANSSNYGSVFLVLTPFAERRGPGLSANAIMGKLRKACAEQVREADVKIFGAPAIPGLGVAGGWKVIVEDRGGLGIGELQKQADALTEKFRGDPTLVGVLNQFRSRTPQLYLDVDRTKVQALGVNLTDVNQTLQIELGSLYVNSFNLLDRHWQVTLQAEGEFRTRPDTLTRLQVRSAGGEMVPLSALVTLKDVSGPVSVQRYNLYPAAAVSGSVKPDASSGDAIAAVDRLAESLPRSMKTEWTELFFLQIRTGNTAIVVFGLAVVFVFLALAALYESWALPLAVILVVPLCLLCSVGGVLIAGRSVDIFVQIGLVVLVGLACKNAILIVEFAEVLNRGGKPHREAALEASRVRLRPILMTSLAFILGVSPLVVATGAGAEMRQSLGVAVFSGMLGVTAFGVFLTPVFFDRIQWAIDGLAGGAGLLRYGTRAAVGALAGAGVGYLVAEGRGGRITLAVAAGVAVGALISLAAPPAWGFVRGRLSRGGRA